MIQQTEFSLEEKRRGYHLVTSEIMKHLPPLPQTSLLNLFVKHTIPYTEEYDALVKEQMPLWVQAL